MKFKFPFRRPKHICGVEIAQCNHCESVFCPNCDCFANDMKLCCKEAINAFYQNHRRLDYVPNRKRKKEKVKIKIEDVSDGNL